MTTYLRAADPCAIEAEYPCGAEFTRRLASVAGEALKELQQRRFLKVVARAWEVPFYRRLWRAAGLEPGDIRCLDDVTRLPPYTKADLMASIEAAPPFGDYHGMGDTPDPGVIMHTTSGTTGLPQPLYFGPRDREVQNALLARAYRWHGLRDSDVVHSVYGFGLVNGGHYVREAVLHFTGALLIPAGTGLETPSREQVELMHRFGATVIVGFADYVERLAGVARERGYLPGVDIPVRLISGHLGRMSRTSLSAAWGGAEVFDWYGVGDTGIVAAEGPPRNGLHVWEDAHLVEILDVDTGVPVRDGEPGCICVTALFKDTVYPIVRFNTQDVSTLLPASSEAGIGFRRLAGFQGRADNMVKLRGINVYPVAVGAHLRQFPEANGEYVCHVRRSGRADEMTVVVEWTGQRSPASQQRVEGHLREKLGVAVAVSLVAPGETATLTEIERRQKPVRLLDDRPDPSPPTGT